MGANLTKEEEREIANFLIGLDDGYLSIDLSQQALFDRAQQQEALFNLSEEALSKTFPQFREAAYHILCHFRDNDLLRLESAGSRGWRWVRIVAEAEEDTE